MTSLAKHNREMEQLVERLGLDREPDYDIRNPANEPQPATADEIILDELRSMAQPATAEGEGDYANDTPFCGSCGRNLNQPKMTDCRWCDDEPHRFHVVVNYPYQKCYYCPNDTETKAGQGELTCVTCGASLTYEHTDAQPTTPHTATPWKIEFQADASGEGTSVCLADSKGDWIADFGREDSLQAQVDADFALTAVNAFEGLVAALEYIPEQIDLTTPRNQAADDSDTIAIEVTIGWLREVRDALKLAGKGE